MSETPRDLIARSLHALYGHVHADAEEWDNLWKLRPDAYRREADAILAALTEAGYTIVKRDGWQTVGYLAPETELKIRTTRRCPSVLRISGAQCDLDEGHTGWHRHNGNGNAATWADKPTDWFVVVEPATAKEDQ